MEQPVKLVNLEEILQMTVVVTLDLLKILQQESVNASQIIILIIIDAYLVFTHAKHVVQHLFVQVVID